MLPSKAILLQIDHFSPHRSIITSKKFHTNILSFFALLSMWWWVVFQIGLYLVRFIKYLLLSNKISWISGPLISVLIPWKIVWLIAKQQFHICTKLTWGKRVEGIDPQQTTKDNFSMWIVHTIIIKFLQIAIYITFRTILRRWIIRTRDHSICLPSAIKIRMESDTELMLIFWFQYICLF